MSSKQSALSHFGREPEVGDVVQLGGRRYRITDTDATSPATGREGLLAVHPVGAPETDEQRALWGPNAMFSFVSEKTEQEDP